jgi:hypothetical protein
MVLMLAGEVVVAGKLGWRKLIVRMNSRVVGRKTLREGLV